MSVQFSAVLVSICQAQVLNIRPCNRVIAMKIAEIKRKREKIGFQINRRTWNTSLSVEILTSRNRGIFQYTARVSWLGRRKKKEPRVSSANCKVIPLNRLEADQPAEKLFDKYGASRRRDRSVYTGGSSTMCVHLRRGLAGWLRL